MKMKKSKEICVKKKIDYIRIKIVHDEEVINQSNCRRFSRKVNHISTTRRIFF